MNKQSMAQEETKEPPGVKNGVIVDAAYWLWVDKQRKERPA